MKIGETALVGQYGEPSVSWGSSTGLGDFPTLVWNVGSGYHITIYPDDTWKFAQMAWQSEDPERVHQLHTDIDDVSFDQWHLTYPNYGSVFVDLNGNIMAGSDGNQDMREYAMAIQPNLF